MHERLNNLEARSDPKPAKSSNQHSNTLNQSSFSLLFNSLTENLLNTKQLALQEQHHSSIALLRSHNCKKYLIPFKHITKDPSKISQWKINLWAIYLKISSGKIFLNFLASNRDTCNKDFPINNKTGKRVGFAFIRALTHITDEIIKLDGIIYPDNRLRVEDVTSTRKRTNNNTWNESWRLSVVMNNHPENQNLWEREASASESKLK